MGKAITRVEMDNLGAIAIKAIKTMSPHATMDEVCKILGRAYSKLLANKKLDQAPAKTGPVNVSKLKK